MDVIIAIGIGVGLLLFTTYYLEKHVPKDQIFWFFASSGIVLSILSIYTVFNKSPGYDYFLTFTVMSILIAVLYYEDGKKDNVITREVQIEKKTKEKDK